METAKGKALVRAARNLAVLAAGLAALVCGAAMQAQQKALPAIVELSSGWQWQDVAKYRKHPP